MYVKICGLRTLEHVDAALAAGVDAIGLVLVPSPREVDVETARSLSRRAGSIDRVAVFRDLSPEAIALALAAECTHLQARGAPDAFRALPAPLRPLPVVLENDPFDPLVALDVPILFDAAIQGSGHRASHVRAAELSQRARVVLAGGLTPENVGEAIATVRPFGVDVSSGVERRRGEKDVALLHSFVRAARAALLSLREVSS